MMPAVTEGKTKIIQPITIARVGAKSDITAGDGALSTISSKARQSFPP